MGVEMQFRPAVHPLRPLLNQSVRMSETTTPSEQRRNDSSGDRALWQREFKELLQKYEPERAHQAPALLRVYAGMEYELLQCYRHHYTGKGGFRISSTPIPNGEEPTSSTTSSSKHASGIFSLPKAAIATYLREKRRIRSRPTNFNQPGISNLSNTMSRTTVSTNASKGDDVRSPEMPLLVSRTAPVLSQQQR